MSLARAEDFVGKAFVGAFVGAFFGGVFGYSFGYVAGSINESTLTGNDLEDIYLGLTEFTADGMAWFGAFNCGIMGAIAGMVGSTAATAWRNAWIGLFGVCVALLIGFVASGLYSAPVGHWHEDQIVWLLGSAASGCLGPICGRIAQRNEDRNRSADTASPSASTPVMNAPGSNRSAA